MCFLAGNLGYYSWSQKPTQPLCPLHPCLVVVEKLSCHKSDLWDKLLFIISDVTPLSSRSLKSAFFAFVPPGLRTTNGTGCTRRVQNNRTWERDVKGYISGIISASLAGNCCSLYPPSVWNQLKNNVVKFLFRQTDNNRRHSRFCWWLH